MNKTLKFKSQFVDTILTKDKIITTRLFDDKNLTVGDVVDFINSESAEKFATGKITDVKEITFEEMVKDAADIKGMYDQYAYYYGKQIDSKETVKVISFDLIK